MKLFLNGEEFYYRLRDLLQNSDDINNYKFNNKYHAITKEFDDFLESTVKKYLDAFHNLPLLREEKQELIIQNGSMQHKIKYFEQVICEKDSIIKGMELLLKQKDILISQMRNSQIALRESLSQHENKKESLHFKQTIEDLTHQLQASKLQIFKNTEIIKQTSNELQMERNIYKIKLKQYSIQNTKKLQNLQKTLLEEYSRQIKELKFTNQQKISILKDELWFAQKECQGWKQKYKQQLGFNLLSENEQERL